VTAAPEELAPAQPGGRSFARGLAAIASPRDNVRAVAELVEVVRHRRALVYELARREITTPFAGAALGSFWGFVQPVFLMLVYGFLFGVVFKVKLPGLGSSVALPRDYTVYIVSGLVPWAAFQTAMSRSASLMQANQALVKQVTFDLRILPIASALASSFAIGLGVVFELLYTLGVSHTLPATYALVPVLLVGQVGAMAGLGFFLATVGTFFRDIREVITMFATIAIFVSPIPYLPGFIPHAFRPLLWLNPFSYAVWCWQDLLYFGRFEHPWAWLAFAVWATAALVLGYRLFRKVSPYFADVL
jgi:lipopolysaccharide transport system permease protein